MTISQICRCLLRRLPPLHQCCYIYSTLVDRIVPGYPRETAVQIKEQIGYKEVEGEPIYFHEMKPEEISLAIIMVYAENALNNLCKFDTFLIPIKNKE